MRSRTVVGTLILVLLCFGLVIAPSAKADDSQAKWRYLLYLCADNDLDVYTGAHHVSVVGDDFRELMSVGSSDEVAAYVLVDRWYGPANLFKVHKGSMEEMKDSQLNGKEINMGDPATLRSFLSYTYGATQAQNTLLIFWDHGSIRSVASDYNANEPGARDSLTHFEVVEALSGFKVDVIAADECNVGLIEVAYEYSMKTQAQFLVAAETYTGWRGFPYDATLREMTDNPAMTPRDAAIMMVDQTQLLLNKPPYSGERINSHSAIDLMKVRDLVYSLKTLASMMTSSMPDYYTLVSKASGAAQYCYGANAISQMDLKTFVVTIAAKSTSKELKTACNEVLGQFEATVLAIQASGSLDHMLYGLGICMPNHSWELPSFYDKFAFAGEGWLGFLRAYWSYHGSV